MLLKMLWIGSFLLDVIISITILMAISVIISMALPMELLMAASQVCL